MCFQLKYLGRILAFVLLALVSIQVGHGQESTEAVPDWIWAPQHTAGQVPPQAACFFRKTIQLSHVKRAMLALAGDDYFEVYFNGRRIGEGTADQGVKTYDITPHVRDGDNTIAVKVDNREGVTAGLAARFVVVNHQDASSVHVTDASWKTTLSASVLWTRTVYYDARWRPARLYGPFSSFVANQQINLQRVAVAQEARRADAARTADAARQAEADQKADATRRADAAQKVRAARIARENENAKNARVAKIAREAKAAEQRAAAANRRASVKADDPRVPTAAAVINSSKPAARRKLTRRPAAGENLEVPREFQLQQVAGHADIGSVTAITFDSRGRLIVAREDGQLWLLMDRNQDQTWDTVVDYGQFTKTCQGLLALNNHLYVTGMGEEGLGLYRLSDTDKDDQLDEAELLVAFDGDNLEHGPHGVVLGPDGLLYVMVGNHSPLKSGTTPTSPHRYTYEGDMLRPRLEDPGGHATGVKAPGGYVVRTDPDGKRVEILAAGFRNAYDLAFDRDGSLFTHDSDMESDRGTSWYRPTRVYQIIDGAEYGWRSGWSKWPDYYLDSLPGIADTGRGSPTGMVVYNHRAFPTTYRNSLFSCDWSEGRILVFSCDDNGAGLSAKMETFVQGRPLNVTDIEVGPDGALFIATGGRGTAGNVYRIAWRGQSPTQNVESGSRIDIALRQPQIHSAWARQRISKVKRRLGAKWSTAIRQAAGDQTRPDDERVQALQIMQWLGPRPSPAQLIELTNDPRVRLRRQATYLLGTRPSTLAFRRLAELLADDDPGVRRRACEALARNSQPADPKSLVPLLVSSDRFESWAARHVLEITPDPLWRELVLTTDDQRLFLVGATALMLASPDKNTAQAVTERCMELMKGFIGDDNFLDMLRVQQLALIRSGTTPQEVPELRKTLAEEYPSSSAAINRELIRLLMYLQVDWINDRYVKELDRDSPSVEKLHLAMHLTFLKSGWSTSQKMAVFRYLSSPTGGGNSVPGYVQTAAIHFGSQLSPQELDAALATGHQNPGSAMAALLRLPKQLSAKRVGQIRALDQRLQGQDSETVRRLRVAIVAVLSRDGSEESCSYLRTVYDNDPSRRVEIALGLAETSDEQSWPYLVRSLPILDDSNARAMLVKLRTVRKWPSDANAYRSVILVAQRLGENGAKDAIALLERWQGFVPQADKIPWQRGIEAWQRWYRETYPNEPVPELVVSSAGGKWDPAALLRHLTRAEQEGMGSVENGSAVFVKAQCAKCHRFSGQGESMGPDLTGIGKRFLKREILDAMLFPSKVISDQYAGKIVQTTTGQTYSGIVADGAGDELIILESNGKKTRLPKDEVDQIEPSRVSAMPEGLLNELTLEEITDMFAYLLSDPQRVARAK